MAARSLIESVRPFELTLLQRDPDRPHGRCRPSRHDLFRRRRLAGRLAVRRSVRARRAARRRRRTAARVEFATPAALALFGVASARGARGARLRRRQPRRAAAAAPRRKRCRGQAAADGIAALLCRPSRLCRWPAVRAHRRRWRDLLVLATPPGGGRGRACVAERRRAGGRRTAPEPEQPAGAPLRDASCGASTPKRVSAPADAAARARLPGRSRRSAGEPLATSSRASASTPTARSRGARRAENLLRSCALAWPEANGRRARIALLSGTPAFDKGRLRRLPRLWPVHRRDGPFARSGDAPSAARARAGRTEQPPSEPPPPSEPAPPKVGAASFVRRPSAAPRSSCCGRPRPTRSPNVIPIRPGALAGSPSAPRKRAAPPTTRDTSN